MDMIISTAPVRLPDQEATQRATRQPFFGQPFFGENGFGFDDILDAVNPLQHIPLLNTVYRHLTGDEISTGSRLAGGALFGGALGFAASLANAVVEDISGRDVGEHLIALVWPGQSGGDNPDPAQGYAAMTAALHEIARADVQEVAPTIAAIPNSFLAALPPREAAREAREAFLADRMASATQQPIPAASGNVPTLSPAAMEALLLSVNMTGAEDEENSDANSQSNLAQDPASFAAWQAAAMSWTETRH